MTKRILLAGLLIALCCLAVPAMALAANYAFTPNMGVDNVNNTSPTDQAATVSKVDAITNVEIARYYTVPRWHQMVDAFGDPSGVPFPYYPGDWRTNRLIVSPDGDAWVLNTGADEYAKAVTIQGTVVRIQGETTGLIQTATTTIPLTFGTDDAVTVFAVGAPGDIPRTINFDSEGDLWIGFHKAGSKYGYFQKYTYDPCYNTLTAVEGANATSATYDLAPYNADIDKNGILWFASYGTGRIYRNVNPTNSDDGVYSFDTNNPAAGVTKYDMVNHPPPEDHAYGVLVDDSLPGTDVRVYATSLEGGAYMWVYNSTTPLAGFTRVTVTGGNGLRGLAFDNYGTIWIASSNNGNVSWYDPDGGTSGYYTGVGSTPVGVGKDFAGDMWIVVRNANKLVTFTPPATPTSGASVTTIAGFQNVPVGPWPYVYGDFIREPVYYQICGYKYEFGTDPSVGLDGWTINLYKEVDDEFPEVPTAITLTDEYGHYCFTGLEAGLYKVTESYQEDWYPVVAEHDVTLPDSDPCNPVEISYDFINAPIYTYCETVWAAVTEQGTERFVPAPGDWATYINDYTTGTGYYTADNPKVYPLFAGQTHPTGELWVYDSGGTLFVKYVALEDDPEYKPDYCGGWKLSEYHLQVVDEFDGFDAYRTYNTKTKSFKNPIPGSFTNKWEGEMTPETEWIEIDIAGFGDADLFIAAHGVACWQGVLCSAIPEFPS